MPTNKLNSALPFRENALYLYYDYEQPMDEQP
jgi:hypothetical protein